MSKLSTNILSLTVVQLITYISPIIALPYLSRTLNVESFGLAMLMMSIIIISNLLTDFGFNLYSPHWIANNSNDKNKISKHISAIFILKTILFFLTSILLLIYFLTTKNITSNKSTLYWLTVLALLSQTFQIIWFFQGIEKMLNITYLTFLSKLSYILFIVLIVKDENDVAEVILSYALSNIIATTFGILIFYRLGFKIKASTSVEVLTILKKSFPFFLSRAAVSIYTSASTLIIGSSAGLTQAALYSSAEKLYQAGQSLSFPISQALYPYLARTKNILAFYKFILTLIPPLIISIGVIYYFSTDIIIIFYGVEYSDASDILRIFLITTIVNFVAVNFGYPAFSIISRLDIANNSVILAAIVQLIMIIFLYFDGSITAKNIAITVLITELFVMLIRVLLFLRISKRALYEYK
ncbi:TPA: oligosaccharide flippase family protein [Proteus mirabilis]|uniref:oligosaccharide flippase family protein n=1 Tax=Morganella morganii TaxID=582 RepID=UPI0027962099|nr:oligosaccharide flippase family protein [Morganella morganii]WLV39865.1 oligosaccharide flippase family protein [Morganella morganii]HEM8846781.1 oligosaccharide flippase family protein [Proteus mirabilis]